MIYDDQIFSIDEQAEDLFEAVKNSTTFKNYLAKKRIMQQDKKVQSLRLDFLTKKNAFAEIDRWGKYASGRSDLKIGLAKSKRAYDLHPKVAEFHYAQTKLQTLLDEIAMAIARAVSSDVKVATASPVFELKSACKGDCHVRKDE
ncbi:MAG TPA: YlbF family regulator [Tetragenococcus sp.]|nr:YlbF family regulator [Tetragenococcus sp.]